MARTRVVKITLEDVHNFYFASHLIPHLSSMRESEVNRVIEVVESFAKKLVNFTIIAVNGELKHAASGSEEDIKGVMRVIRDLHRDYKEYCEECKECEEEPEDEEEYFNDRLNDEFSCNEVDVSENIRVLEAQFGSLANFEKLRNSNKITLAQAASLFNKLGWDNDDEDVYSEGYGSRKWAKIAEAAIQLQKYLPVTEQNLGDIVVWIDHLIDLEHNTELFLYKYCSFKLSSFLNKKGRMEPEDFDKASLALQAMLRRQKEYA